MYHLAIATKAVARWGGLKEDSPQKNRKILPFARHRRRFREGGGNTTPVASGS
jgi:hypothetical protein